MVLAASAGVPPDRFWRLSLGEIAVVVEGEAMRRRAGLVDRIVAAVRALGQAFGGGNALDGIVDDERRELSMHELRQRRFWRPESNA